MAIIVNQLHPNMQTPASNSLNMRRLPACLAMLPFLCATVSLQSPQANSDTHQMFLERLSAAAIQRTQLTVRYDPAYVRIPYPNGDIPAGTGVCTDEVIRSYRALGIDLQKEVHEDMQQNFSAYPNQRRWMLAHTDRNIDHRRVPNLRVFFSRKGESLPITSRAEDYLPGEPIPWDLGGHVPHTGNVWNKNPPKTGRYPVEDNIGAGPKMEDVPFNWKITGRYRYFGPGGNGTR